jgi:hypothetical protein
VENTAEVEAFIMNFDDLANRSLCLAESAELIRKIAKGD